MSRAFLLLGFLLFAAAAVAKTPEDTLVMAWNIDSVSSLDPGMLGEVNGDEITSNVCDALIFLDQTDASRIVPGLAESWSVSADGKTLTLNLRANLRHPSGNPVTAEDAAWSMRRLLKLNSPGAGILREWGMTDAWAEHAFQAVDARTLVVTFDQAYPMAVLLPSIFPARSGYVLDRVEILKHAKGDDLGTDWLRNNSACVGPYHLRSWTISDTIVLERNPDYWGKPPALRRVIIRHVPESSAQLLQLRKGDIDVARSLNTEDLAAVSGDPALKILSQPRQSLFFATFNTQDPILGDPRVRLAFRYLIDYEGLHKTIMRFDGFPRASVVPFGAFGALPMDEGQPFRLDLDRARALLAEAGHADGFRREMLIGTQFPSREVAEHLQFNAAKVGIDLQVNTVAAAQLIARLRARNFQIAALSWNINVADAHVFISRHVYNPDNSPDAKLGNFASWWASWQDPWFNDATNRALFERDPAQRQAIYFEIQRRLMQVGPSAFLFQLVRNFAARNEVTTFNFTGNRAYYGSVVKQ